jgi:putative transposase
MERSRFTDQQIALALQQTEQGTAVGEVTCKMVISEQTFYRWKKKFGRLMPSEVRKLWQLEEEFGAFLGEGDKIHTATRESNLPRKGDDEGTLKEMADPVFTNRPFSCFGKVWKQEPSLPFFPASSFLPCLIQARPWKTKKQGKKEKIINLKIHFLSREIDKKSP